MKDLGELLKVNVDSNQKHVKDHTKPFESDGGASPKKASESKKSASKLKGPKQPTGKSKRFKKIKKTINVEKIPGSN
jgi:hypothetical protein